MSGIDVEVGDERLADDGHVVGAQRPQGRLVSGLLQVQPIAVQDLQRLVPGYLASGKAGPT